MGKSLFCILKITYVSSQKKGPLVYESSASTAASQSVPVNLPTAAGPMSFAAMAKKATAPPPPPPVVPVYVPPPPPAVSLHHIFSSNISYLIGSRTVV